MLNFTKVFYFLIFIFIFDQQIFRAMKKHLSFLLFALLGVSSVAQTTGDYFSPAKPKLSVADRVSASVEAGTGLSFVNSKMAGVTTFLAPKINYQLSSRLRLNIGLVHYTCTPNTAFFMNRNEAVFNPGNGNVSGNLIMAGGDYALTKKMTLSGAVMTDVNSLNSTRPNTNFKAASIGLDYKVSEHSSIGFRATVSEGQRTYYNNAAPAGAFNPVNTGFSDFGGFR